MTVFILAIGSLTAFSRAPQAGQEVPNEQMGVRTFEFQDASRDRSLSVEIWYPTQKTGPVDAPQDIWIHPAEIRNAALSPRLEKYPLVLMSHGHAGDRRDKSWLVESLVKNGYIVASVEHPGSSWRTYDPFTSLLFWERARDVTFALDEILQEPALKDHIDSAHIGFVGYSLGGLTGLSLGGAPAKNVKEVILAQQTRFKEIDPQLVEQIDFTDAYQDFSEPRIKAIVLLSPAAFVFDADSLKQVKVPVAMVATEDDEVLPHKEHAYQIITHLVPEKLKLLKNKISHYAFLNRVSERGKKLIYPPEVTASQVETSRPQLHKEVSQFAVEFFKEKI